LETFFQLSQINELRLSISISFAGCFHWCDFYDFRKVKGQEPDLLIACGLWHIAIAVVFFLSDQRSR
jgi:hypothetical protein